MGNIAVTSMSPPDCYRCRHFRGGSGTTCAAFPDGIPRPILFGDPVVKDGITDVGSPITHTKPYPGDRGIMFEEVPGDLVMPPDEDDGTIPA